MAYEHNFNTLKTVVDIQLIIPTDTFYLKIDNFVTIL